MNKEHKKALIHYAKQFGGIAKPTRAKMINLNPIAMTLEVDGDTIEISFAHKLLDSTDAHRTLIDRLKEATEKPVNK